MAGVRPQKLDAFARVLPILEWLPTYQPRWLHADAIAGLTLWGILVPEMIAKAAMADAPLQAGLYTLLGSLVVYAVFGTTRRAVSAPISASSVMMAAVVSPFLVSGPKELGELLVLLVLVVGIILLLSGLLRLGSVTAFISHSVMTGFLFGLAIHIGVSQAPKLFGLHKSDGETIYQFWDLIERLGAANWATFTVGAVALVLLFVLEMRTPRVPAPLMIMVAGILAVSVFRLSDRYGVQIVGTIQTGLPVVSVPKINFDDVLDLLPGALAIALVVLSEALGVGHALGRKYGTDVDPDQELIAMGVANVASACLGGLVSGLSMSCTAVNDRAGAKSQVSSLTAAGMVLITLLALMPLFHDLPEAVLGAIIIHAVVRMMKIDELKRFYRFHVAEFRNEVRSLLSASSPPQAILIDLHANFGIDLSSTDMLLGLVAEAEKTSTEIVFAELQDPVRNVFRRCGLLDLVGENHLFQTIDDGVQDYLRRHPAVVRSGIELSFPLALRSQ